MKTILRSLLLFVLLIPVAVKAQVNYRIHLNVSQIKAELRGITVYQDSTQDVFIALEKDGIARIGTTRQGAMINWDAADGAYRRSKTKMLAGVPADFYDNFDEAKTGKLKLFGNMTVDYYSKLDGLDNIGKVKSIGGIIITYYDRFDADPELTGRLKSIGDNKITYYTKYDGLDNIGLLKSIGGTIITYFDRYAGREYLGKVKSVKGKTPSLYITQE